MIEPLRFPLPQKSVVSIVGPTAVGKTELALLLSQGLISRGFVKGTVIISADSRQVYQGMGVITGVDRPETLPENTELYGQEFLRPDEEWSLSAFQKMAWQLIEAAWEKEWLPIVVGGTGLYYTHLFTQELGEQPGPNWELRKELEGLGVAELRARLAQADPLILEKMNNSDSNNPRRLIRALEIIHQPAQGHIDNELSPPLQPDYHHTIGLTDDIEVIEDRISKRVIERWTAAVQEVERLKAEYDDSVWRSPSFSATGVKEVRAFLEDQLTKDQAIELWTKRERQYAKRQLTWWKKYGEAVQWVSRSEYPDLKQVVEKLLP